MYQKSREIYLARPDPTDESYSKIFKLEKSHDFSGTFLAVAYFLFRRRDAALRPLN